MDVSPLWYSIYWRNYVQDSLTKYPPVPMEASGSGRNGARLWLSYDRLFIIKQITSDDVMEMHRIMQDYHQVWLGDNSQANKQIRRNVY